MNLTFKQNQPVEYMFYKVCMADLLFPEFYGRGGARNIIHVYIHQYISHKHQKLETFKHTEPCLVNR